MIHLVAERLYDRSCDLGLLSDVGPPLDPPVSQDGAKQSIDPRERPRHRHPRDVRVLPRSRDFH